MSDDPADLPPIDPSWALPERSNAHGSPVSGAMFARLLAAARKGQWPAVYLTFADGEMVPERDGNYTRERPARRRTLDRFLELRPDLRAILEEACNQKRDELLASLESEVEAIALGPGDVSRDFGKDGRVTRERFDKRNKLYAILKLLQANDRAKYGEKRSVEIDGRVSHDHRHDHAHSLQLNAPGYVLNPDAIAALPPERARLLIELLGEVEALNLETPNERRELIEQPASRPLPPAE